MSRRVTRTVSPALALALLGAASIVLADAGSNDQASVPSIQTKPATEVQTLADRNLTGDDQGFFTSLPAVDNLSLREEIEDVREELRKRQSKLAESLERHQFKPADAVIVALAPGGLLYAAYKTQRRQSLIDNLASLDRRITDLNRELLDLEGISGSFRVASLP